MVRVSPHFSSLAARRRVDCPRPSVVTNSCNMLKLSLDVDMNDVNLTSPTHDRTYSTYTDNDIRSPRTPTYVPTSPTSKMTPFDPARIFTSPEISTTGSPLIDSLPEPTQPLSWIWQCHLCQSRYPLGVTRRCLLDGHFYCSGEADRPNLKKRKRGRSCSSEFDYIGWREWGEWKRKVLGTLENNIETRHVQKGCEKCDYPSQCRYTAGQAPGESHVDEEKTGAFTDSPMTETYQTCSLANGAQNSSFCSTKSVTFDSIFASATVDQEQLQLADFLKDPIWKTESQFSNSSTARSLSTLLSRVVSSAEKWSGTKSTLSPIAEEFFFQADPVDRATDSISNQPGMNHGGIGSSEGKGKEEVVDLT